MDIRRIRYLVSAIEGGSLSAAAKDQFVTVQAVSKGISELESELGFQLLTRGNHGVVPTAAGSALYRRAQALLDDFDGIVDFSKGFPAGKDEERLSICLCSPQFNNDNIALANLAQFIGTCLQLKVNIITATGSQCLDALNGRVVDAVASIGDFSSPDTDTVAIGTMPSGVVLSTNHPLARNGKVRIGDAGSYPVLWTDDWDSFGQSMLGTYLARGLASPIIRYEDGMDIDLFFQQQMGMILAVHLPGINLTKRDTVNLPIDPVDTAHIPLNLITLKNHKKAAYLKLEKNAAKIFHGGRIL